MKKKEEKRKEKEIVPRGFQGMPTTPNAHRDCGRLPANYLHLQLN
jgi:hypothetical protein